MMPLNNLKLIAYGMAILAVFGSAWWIRGMVAEGELKTALELQQKELVAKCEEDKQITAEIDNEQNKKITNLSKQLNRARSMYANKCLPISASTRLDNAATSGGELTAKNGVDAQSLLQLAADGEQYRLTLISCQDYIRKAITR